MTVKDFPDSIKAILYDRIVSPLSGTFIFSWLVWNWKLVYFFFVFDEGESIKAKIAYISTNFNNLWNLIWFPLLSTAFLIGLYPFISTGAYWLHLWFKNWQNDIKNTREKQQLLTVEQSIKLRLAIQDEQEKFIKLEKEKDEEIERLNKEIPYLKEKSIKYDDLKSEYDKAVKEQERLYDKVIDLNAQISLMETKKSEIKDNIFTLDLKDKSKPR